VSVVGEAVLRAEPEEAMVLVTLSALEDTPGPALEDVARRGGSLSALLDELSIAPSDRSTTGVTVQEEFDHTNEGRRSLGHRASSTVAVRLTEVELIGRLVTRVTTQLDARVDGPRWQVAPDNPLRLEAARQAAADGKRKAQAYAEGVGAQLGELVGLADQLGELVGLAEPGAAQALRGAGGGWFAAAGRGDMPIDAARGNDAAYPRARARRSGPTAAGDVINNVFVIPISTLFERGGWPTTAIWRSTSGAVIKTITNAPSTPDPPAARSAAVAARRGRRSVQRAGRQHEPGRWLWTCSVAVDAPAVETARRSGSGRCLGLAGMVADPLHHGWEVRTLSENGGALEYPAS
jgi:uncharacterized protein YggE